MSGSVSAIWYTQMIEYRVAVVFQQALAQALVLRSESLASRCEDLRAVSVQASEGGDRLLQSLQWTSREACEAAIEQVLDDSFLGLLQQYHASAVNFAAFTALRSLARHPDGALYCQVR
ncbi:antibiotic biosynthesis monooxygenase [Pseudomonas fulva]|nr:antibiotic biosynthesis monooxygenase [Pseudomonas fulva]MBF8699435.1 antibiotic biosynthesis monooxygenase [Pseudomonas fulva]